jgi:hypothetical protein
LQGVDQWFIKAFTEFVIEGMYKYVRPSKIESSYNDQSIDHLNGLSSDIEILDLIGRDDSIDLLRLNLPARLLVILSNVSYLQGEGLRNLLTIFGDENIQISPNLMVSTLANVERAVTQLFLQGQVGRIIGPIEASWLAETSKENQISLSTAVYKSLLSLADVQSLISDISPKDPLSLLRDLVNTFITKMLQILKEKPRLKFDQVIQARIDMEFLKRKFEDSSLLTRESVELMEKIDLILLNCEKIDDFPSYWSKFESNWNGPFSNLFSFK